MSVPKQAYYGNDALPFEVLLRAALSRRPQRPAVINVMAWGRRLAWISAQHPQLALCAHYGVTAISIRDALLPLIKNPDLVSALNHGGVQGENEAPDGEDLSIAAKMKKYVYPTAQHLCGIKVRRKMDYN